MHSDARIHLHLFETSCGGLKAPIPSGIYRGTMMFDDIRGYDFRADFLSPFSPGESRDFDVAFLSPNEVSKLLIIDKKFKIWNGRSVGEGRVLRSFI